MAEIGEIKLAPYPDCCISEDTMVDIEVILPGKMLQIVNVLAQAEGVTTSDWLGKIISERVDKLVLPCDEEPIKSSETRAERRKKWVEEAFAEYAESAPEKFWGEI